MVTKRTGETPAEESRERQKKASIVKHQLQNEATAVAEAERLAKIRAQKSASNRRHYQKKKIEKQLETMSHQTPASPGDTTARRPYVFHPGTLRRHADSAASTPHRSSAGTPMRAMTDDQLMTYHHDHTLYRIESGKRWLEFIAEESARIKNLEAQHDEQIKEEMGRRGLTTAKRTLEPVAEDA